ADTVNVSFSLPLQEQTLTGYLATGLPIAIRDDVTACDATQKIVFNGQPVVPSVPDHCMPVTLLPGGLTTLTNMTVPVKLTDLPSLLRDISVDTGPLTFRYSYVDTNGDGKPDAPQT